MQLDNSFSPLRVPITSLRLGGTRVVIAGGTGGIGRALSRAFASRGAQVTVVGQTFRDVGVPDIEFVQADLSLMRNALRVAEQLPVEAADLMIFTAGIFAAPKRQETAEQIERDLAVSYLNRLVMLREIAPRLGTNRAPGARKARVFNIAFPGAGQIGNIGDLNAERSYKAFPVHMNTVAGNEMLVLDAVNRYPELNTYGLNPGSIKTNIRSNFLGGNKLLYNVIEGLIGLFTPSADTYAAGIVPLLMSADLDDRSGTMFDRKGRAILASPGLTADHVAAFMAASTKLVVQKTGVALDD